MRVQITIALLLLFGSRFSFSQNILLDSLNTMLQENPTVLERIDIHLGMARIAILKRDFDLAKEKSQWALESSQEEDYQRGQILALQQLGGIAAELQQDEEADELREEAQV